MEQTITANYFNPVLKIALVNWRQAWDISGTNPEQLLTEIYKGNLVFRKKGSTHRISYKQLKKGLIKKQIILHLQPLPF